MESLVPTESNISYEDWLINLSHALDETKRYYTEDEPVNNMIAYFAHAVKLSMHTEFFDLSAREMFLRNPELDPHYAINKMLRGVSADQLQHNVTYPLDFEDESAWLNAFDQILQNHSRLQSYLYNISQREIQSNVADRYKTVKFLAALMKDRWDGPPSHLDVGSSRLHGDKKLVYESDSDVSVKPFGKVKILDTTDYEKFEWNEKLTRLTNFVISQHMPFGNVMGIDKTNIDNPRIRHWIKGCSLKPNELLMVSKTEEYELIDGLDPRHERIEFFRGDFSSNHDVRTFRDWSPVRDYDIITFSTVFYQGTKSQRQNMLVNATNMLNPNGIILIQDAPDGNFEKVFNYYSSVIDSQDIEAGEQTILCWENGRCNRAVIENGKLIFPSGQKTIAEALLELEDEI